VNQLPAAAIACHKSVYVIAVDGVVVNVHRSAAATASRRFSAVIPDHEVFDGVVSNNKARPVETIRQRSLNRGSRADEVVVLDE
jgi:hypothetical protein